MRLCLAEIFMSNTGICVKTCMFSQMHPNLTHTFTRQCKVPIFRNASQSGGQLSTILVSDLKFVFSVVSVTTAHVQCIKDKKGHFSADAELEDLGETPYKAPKKKGPQIVKF